MSRTRGIAASLGTALVALLLVPNSAVAGQPDQPDARAALTGSVLGYQYGEGVCLIDPDVAGAQPVVVTPDGRFAGVTADGRTVAGCSPVSVSSRLRPRVARPSRSTPARSATSR